METKKYFLPLILAFAAPAFAHAGESADDGPSVSVALDARADYDYVKPQGADGSTGIYGRYFNIKVNGNINSKLSYSWRQRLNKYKEAENDVFNATDWIYLDYKISKNWSVAAGKQVVLVGGWEYDAAPIDVFFACRFWNNYACYQFGGSATYTTDDGRHAFSAQVTNSPYQPLGKSCYAYNLYWAGNIGCYHALWSVNLVEYEKGRYCNYLALGNKFDLGPLTLELDVMNRATSARKYWFADYSLIGLAELAVTPWMTLMAKGGKDDWYPNVGADVHYDKPFYGGGFFFFPNHGKKDVRIHALADCFHDNSGVRNAQVNIGLTWVMPVYSSKK